MRVVRRGYLPGFVATALLLGPAGLAASGRSNVPFDLIAASAPLDGGVTRTAKRNAVIATVDIFVPDAIELDGDIDVSVRPMIASEADVAIGAGSILVNSKPSQHVYCGRMMSRGLGKAGPCLIDSDGDGKFDQAVKGGADAYQPMVLSIATNGKMMGISYAKHPVPLRTPVPYHRVSYTKGPVGKAELNWQSNFNPKRPGPVKIAFWLGCYNDWAGTWLAAAPTVATFTGEPVQVDVDGITVTVLGFGDKGELRFRIGGALRPEPIRFDFIDRIDPTIIFI